VAGWGLSTAGTRLGGCRRPRPIPGMGPGADRYHLGGGGAPRRRRQAALAAGRCRPTGRSPLCGSAAALGRGADVRLAGAVPAVEQGLRVPASDFGEFHLPRDESYPPPEADRLMAFQTPFRRWGPSRRVKALHTERISNTG